MSEILKTATEGFSRLDSECFVGFVGLHSEDLIPTPEYVTVSISILEHNSLVIAVSLTDFEGAKT